MQEETGAEKTVARFLHFLLRNKIFQIFIMAASIHTIYVFFQNAFKPSLPSEVVVNFHVNCHKLVFTIYVLNTLSAAPASSPQV